MHVLVVDDDPSEAASFEGALRQAGYTNLQIAPTLQRIDENSAAEKPDLVVLGSRFNLALGARLVERVCALTEDPDHVPVLIVTDDEPTARRQALDNGATDVVLRPVDDAVLLNRVRNALRMRRVERELSDRSAAFAEAVRRRTGELEMARIESLSVLASMAEYHDDDNYQHTQRVGLSAALIARALGLPGELVSNIRDAAPLHDIGKVGISRRILLKPGELTPTEWTHMTRHVDIGARILDAARSPVLRLAADIARTHHERWDGTGYLAGLAGEDIPLAGRITAVADVFDVLTHDRPYNRAWPRERAIAEIRKQAGTQFDPVVVAAFATIDLQAWSELLAGQDAEQAA